MFINQRMSFLSYIFLPFLTVLQLDKPMSFHAYEKIKKVCQESLIVPL